MVMPLRPSRSPHRRGRPRTERRRCPASLPLTCAPASAGRRATSAVAAGVCVAWSLSTTTDAAAQDVEGTPRDDRLVGTAGIDNIWGLAGDDVILGRGGADYLEGNRGD